jgi:hypothetical protein
MYERSYGYRYAETADASTTDIAKVIRRDIKQAQEEGLLPARWSYSVRSPHGTSIDVDVRDCPDAWRPCDGLNCHNVWCAARNDPQYAHAATPHDVLTDEAAAAKMTLERIHGAYNHDGSEIQTDYFDVRYYGHVEFEDAGSADFRRREAERIASRKAEREGGTVVGKVTNYKRDGSSVTHLVVEIPIEGGVKPTRKALVCGSRSWSGSTISRAHDDAVVTCSRCAKRDR